jgi:SagB-type dehydrogenase family enzyme
VLRSAAEVETWRAHAPLAKLPPATGPIVPLHPYTDAEIPRDPIEQVILRRGSARKFAQVPIGLRQLSTMLDRATRGIPADFLDTQGTHLNGVYLIVNAVEGLEPGAYAYHRDGHALECLKPGNFRAQAGHLGLDQQLPAEAAADIFFLTDLEMILERFGNRGYRAVQLEAGILSGKLYLAAYAQRLSATGLTFYDDEVSGFFSPHARGKSVTMLVATGYNAKSALQT